MEALVRLSKFVMKNRDDVSVSEDDEEATLGEGIKVAKSLDRFLDEYIEPVACDYHEETKNLRIALVEQETLKVYHDHRKRFEKVLTRIQSERTGRREKPILDMIKSSLTLWDVGEFLLSGTELLKKNSKHEIGDKSHKGKKGTENFTVDSNINFYRCGKARLIFAQSMQFSYGTKKRRGALLSPDG